MSEERKRTVWPWIVALLVGLPVLYVASFGPACWLVGQKIIEPERVATYFSPVISLLDTSKTACRSMHSLLSLTTSVYNGFTHVCAHFTFRKRSRR